MESQTEQYWTGRQLNIGQENCNIYHMNTAEYLAKGWQNIGKEAEYYIRQNTAVNDGRILNRTTE